MHLCIEYYFFILNSELSKIEHIDYFLNVVDHKNYIIYAKIGFIGVFWRKFRINYTFWIIRNKTHKKNYNRHYIYIYNIGSGEIGKKLKR